MVVPRNSSQGVKNSVLTRVGVSLGPLGQGTVVFTRKNKAALSELIGVVYWIALVLPTEVETVSQVAATEFEAL